MWSLLARTCFSSLSSFAVTAGIMALAEAVYVLFGFGAGLIAVGSLAMVLPDVTDVVVLLLLVNVPAELYVVARGRRDVAWRGVLLICAGIAAGVPAGTWILGRSEPQIVLFVLGAFLVVVGALFLLLPPGARLRLPSWSAPPTGVLSGLLAGMFGTGGPPVILYYRLAGADKRAFRGNLMAIFLLISAVRIPSYVVAGLITWERLWSTVAVFPAVLLGAVVGSLVHLKIEELTFQRLVSLGLGAIGVLLLVRT